jgi:hypothetical protein
MTLAEIRAMLYINKHRLDDELQIQGDIMDRISTQVVLRNSAMIEAKDNLAKTEGRIAEDVRDTDVKMTVGMIDAKVKRDPERMRAWERYQEARAAHEAWAGLLDAWKQKGYSIKTLADLYAANYYTLSSTQTSERNRSRDDAVDAGRAALRRASHGDRLIDPEKEIVKTSQQVTPRRRTQL